MTRVLFLTESFHPVLGGGENHIRLLATRLAAAGMPSLVLTRLGDRRWARDEMLDGVRLLRVPPSGTGRLGKYAMVPGVLAALWRHRHEYDVIVVRGGRVLGVPGVIAGRLLRRPVVLQPEVTGELSGEIYTWGTRWHRPWIRRLVGMAARLRNTLLRRADAFVAISSSIRKEMLAAGVAPQRVEIIPHGVDTRRFRPAAQDEPLGLRRRLGLSPDGDLIVYTGRLLRGKGIEVLLDAFAAVAVVETRAHVVLVGSGAGQVLSVEAELRARVAIAPLAGRVTFTGRVDNVEDYLRAADIFAFPSFFEAMPLSVLEAAACGLACIASGVGGIVDVIEDGVSGILVEPGDTGALADGLRTLLTDTGRRAALGAAARKRVLELFELESTIRRYRTLFERLSARGSQS